MPRPRKRRLVEFEPENLYFKPRGVPLKDLEEVGLKVEEFEAIRLKHKENLNQEEAAERMDVSRSTFGRILNEAHEKICDFLIEGKALRVEGGQYVINARKFECKDCGNVWDSPRGEGRPQKCPECGKENIVSKHEIKNLE